MSIFISAGMCDSQMAFLSKWSGWRNSSAMVIRRCMASSRSKGRLVAIIIKPSCLGNYSFIHTDTERAHTDVHTHIHTHTHTHTHTLLMVYMYLSTSVNNKLMLWHPRFLLSKMASHSSKNKMASLTFASLKINLKFSPDDIPPRCGKLINKT